MTFARTLLIVGFAMVATATAHAASTGLSINEDHKSAACKLGCRMAPINPLAQY